MTTEPTTVTDEINAYRKIAAILDKLDPATQARAVRWIADRWPVQASEEPT